MDAVYYISGTLLTISLLGLIVSIVFFLFKPHVLTRHKRINQPVSRARILGVGLVAIMISTASFSSVMAATEPASVKQARITRQAADARAAAQKLQAEQDAAAQARARQLEASKPVVKTETRTEAIAFETTEQNDSSLALGVKKVTTAGVEGQRTITYEVTYTKNVETARKEVKSEVTLAPVTQVTLVGTYIPPVATPAAPSSGSGYVNSNGNYVPSPSSNPTGATAQCRDGSYSYSQHRSGTCSHHGGVASWL
jgi:hypothetical protein